MAKGGKDYDYREDYFRRHKGLFGMGIYFCSYCGKPVKKQGSHVDHIIPKNKRIKGVNKNSMTGKAISNASVSVFNRSFNTTIACSKCNLKKSDKIDYRVIQGYASKVGGAAVGTAVGGTYRVASGTVKVGAKVGTGVVKAGISGTGTVAKYGAKGIWWTLSNSISMIFKIVWGILSNVFKLAFSNILVTGVIILILMKNFL